MDIIPPKKPNAAMRQQRDRTAHRRAYLDTYAKNRVHIDMTGRPENARHQMPDQMEIASLQLENKFAPQWPIAKTSTSIDDIPFDNMVALCDSKPQQQITDFVPTQNMQSAPVQAVHKIVSPKQSKFSEIRQVLKQSKMTKRQDRALQKRQQIQLKEAETHQPKDTAYFDALAQSRQKRVLVSDIRQVSSTQYDGTSLLDESGNFATSDIRNDENDQKVEANLRALYAGPLSKQIAASSENSASASHMRTIIASAFACGIMAVGIFTVFGNYGSQPVVAQPIGSPVIEVEAPASQSQTGTPVANSNKNKASDDIIPADPSHPARIIIGSLGINAPVQGLGTTPEGLMAVPKSYGIVGWYNKGAVPGQPGPAVLAGHYTGGNKGVFDKLKDAQDGQLITVANGRGQTFTYKITGKTEYDKNKVPMAELFKNSADSRLEIITCSGQWQSSEYNKRLVVSAEIVR